MNQNEMDRYHWRTGQRWSADHRPVLRVKSILSGPLTTLLAITFAITFVILALLR